MNDTEEFINQLNTDSVGPHRSPEISQPERKELSRSADSRQWAVHPDDTYAPCGSTVQALPTGVYRNAVDQFGTVLFVKVKLVTDDLVRLPDTASDRVLEGIAKFWESEAEFRKFGQVFKRGVLLWGPPGSGKTVTVTMLVHDVVQRGGTVILSSSPELTAQALAQFRRVEPDRKLICILEDLDELTDRYGESNLLALLDGEQQVDKIVYVATTNYPERLDARLVNRPSRFDEVIKIGMPSAAARRVYLRSRLKISDLADADLQVWVEETDGLSIAHLRELVAAVFCLGRDYEDTLKRLKAMQRRPSSTGDKAIGLSRFDEEQAKRKTMTGAAVGGL